MNRVDLSDNAGTAQLRSENGASSSWLTLWMTILTAIATCALAFFGYWTLEASTRAWVGPTEAIATIDDSGLVTIKITYKNSGREPALQFGDDWADDWAGVVDDDRFNFDFYDKCKSDGVRGRCSERAERWQHECEQKNLFQDRVAFPDFSYVEYKKGLRVEKEDKNRIVVVQGCFVYRSQTTFFNPLHRTAFCYFYRVGQLEAQMRACPAGNSAT
jgi:hypothetical protein